MYVTALEDLIPAFAINPMSTAFPTRKKSLYRLQNYLKYAPICFSGCYVKRLVYFIDKICKIALTPALIYDQLPCCRIYETTKSYFFLCGGAGVYIPIFSESFGIGGLLGRQNNDLPDVCLGPDRPTDSCHSQNQMVASGDPYPAALAVPP